jgi:IS5 family transposase
MIRCRGSIREWIMRDQLSFADAFVDPRLGSNKALERIAALIDWSRLEPLLADLRSGETGRPPYPALSMLKALYLQALYDLSDPELEQEFCDRLSFRAFCGFALDERTPDETTICRFRSAAAAAGVLERCFAEVNRQLEAQGLVVKKGTLMDATIVAATHRPPRREAGMGAPNPREPGADWTNKGGKSYFGYKLHVGVDEGSGLIRKAVFTAARVQDNEVAEALISGDEAAVYADRLYESKARRAALKARGIKDRIMHRRHKYMPQLPHWMAVRNRLIARRRAPVESVFSAMKRLYGKARTRCHSLTVNAAAFLAFATVFNLRRAANVLTA